MTKEHKIQWLNLPGYKGETWNPLLGCEKVSAGCKNCYAEKMAHRISCIEQAKMLKGFKLSELSTQYHRVMAGNKWCGYSHFNKAQLPKPAKWKAPRVIFVCSMGDLFFEKHAFEEINAVFSIMACFDRHIFIVLTKRPEQIVRFFDWKRSVHGIAWQPSANVWMGVTAENQEQANNRLPHLIRIPAAVRFVSVEPMLSEVDISFIRSSSCSGYRPLESHPIGSPDRPFINWVICGGESGHHARPLHPDWVRSLRDQCEAAGVPFFFKQWGEWMPISRPLTSSEIAVLPDSYVSNAKLMQTDDPKAEYFRAGKSNSGRKLDGQEHAEWPKID